MSTNAKVLPASGAARSRATSVFQSVNIVGRAEEFRMAVQLPMYRMPALNYPVYRLLHRLTDNSLMAILTFKGGAPPILVAAVSPDQTTTELGITHALRPHMSELVSVLRSNLKIEQASVLSVKETAEGLAQEWKRDRQHTARILPDNWTYYHMKAAKPKRGALQKGQKLEFINVPQTGRSNPATRFAMLTQGEQRSAAIGLQSLPGNNRYLMGDIEPDGITGEPAAVAPLFNRLLRIAKHRKDWVDFVVGSDRPCLRAELLGKHGYNCDARYNKVQLGSPESTPK